MPITTTGQLQIIGAVYGLSNVTATIISLVNRQANPQTLSVQAANSVFGDTWPNNGKSLTIIYCYDGGTPQVATAEENSQILIGSSQFAESSPLPLSDGPQPVLTVFGATFGPADVSVSVRGMIAPTQQTLSLTPNDQTFGDPWPNVRKTFVIAAAYTGQTPFVDIVIEGTPYFLKYRPPLQILSAFWGKSDVLSVVRANVSRRSLSIAASNSAFGDGWPGVQKSLEVVYQYAAQAPVLMTATEGNVLSVDYDPSIAPYDPPVDPRTLNIIKASFGPADVTPKVSALVSNRTLNFIANNATLGDSWPNVAKAFSLTYSWGPSGISSAVYPENTAIQLSQPTIVSDQSFVSLSGMFAVGDQMQIQSGAGGFWSIGTSGQILATATNAGAQTFTVRQVPSDGDSIALQAADGSYLTVGGDGTLHSGGSAASAALLVPSLQTNGAIVFGVANTTGAPFLAVTSSGAIAASGSYITDFSTSFSILYSATEEGLKSHIAAYALAAEDTDFDPLLLQVVWDLTGGLFLAIGLGPLVNQGTARGGLVNLLKSNPTVWNTITQLIRQANANRTSQVITLQALMIVAKGFYDAGLLWALFRFICNRARWWVIGVAVAKIIEWILLPEVEAAELAASMTIWVYNTSVDIDAYINSGANLNPPPSVPLKLAS